MKIILLISIILFYSVNEAVFQKLESVADDFSVTILNSNVPNVTYEEQAVQSYIKAYALHPQDDLKLLSTFAQYYEGVFPSPNHWKASQECTLFYNPVPRYYVNLNVTVSKKARIVKIFE